uniref:Putative terminase n=1 Tax=viral metagenome TaxID=1070528 RepID=A0A6H1ZVA9_9ZZZZ
MAGKKSNGGRRPSKKLSKGVPTIAEEMRAMQADIVEKVVGFNGLSLVESFFVQEFLISLNYTEAYRRAYAYIQAKPIGKDGQRRNGELSYNACSVEGSKLAKLPRVRRAIEQAIDERITRTKITQDSTLHELYQLAHANILDVGWWKGNKFILYDSDKIPREAAAIIASVKSTKYGMEATLHPKAKALEMLMRHQGMFIEKHEYSFKLDKDPSEMTPEELIDTAKEISERRLQLVQGGKS